MFYVRYADILAPVELYHNCYYFGQWQSGVRNGYGKLFFPDGSYYSGYFKQDRAEGNGRLHHINGDYYKGEFKDNVAHGYG